MRGGKPVRLSTLLAVTSVCALGLTGCGSKGSAQSEVGSDTLTLGAAVSLTGQLAREGALTKEGYELCQTKINDAGGVPVGGKKLKLAIQYQDDTSKPDTAAQLVEQLNDKGVKLILSSYGSANSEAQAAVVERNGQVMADSAAPTTRSSRRATGGPSRCCRRQPSMPPRS
jgi:branched-chain amino acid transport system substrate-binding protein